MESSEWQDSLCIDCGQCFHDSAECDTCAEPRCKECCEDLTLTNYGCSHGICADSGDLEEHLDECDDINDGEYIDDHNAMPSIRWSYDKMYIIMNAVSAKAKSIILQKRRIPLIKTASAPSAAVIQAPNLIFTVSRKTSAER